MPNGGGGDARADSSGRQRTQVGENNRMAPVGLGRRQTSGQGEQGALLLTWQAREFGADVGFVIDDPELLVYQDSAILLLNPRISRSRPNAKRWSKL